MAHANTGNNTADYFKAYIDYSISSPVGDTSAVTVYAGAIGTGNTTDTKGSFTITFSATGQANQTSTGTYTVPHGGGEVSMGSHTFSFTRGTSSASKTIAVSVHFNIVNKSTSSTSVDITIPAKSYTISYNGNGHTGGTVPSAQTKYHGTNITLSSNKPSKSGYTFLGWNTTSSANTAAYQPGASFSGNANTTLYAIWRKNITLSYDANEGSGAPASETNSVYNNNTSYEFTISSTRPTRTNYDFLGWSLSDIATTASYQPNGSITLSDSDTLYAVWKLAYIASTISDISAVRCNLDGTSNDEGGYGKLTFKVSKYSNGSSQDYPTISAKYDTNTAITFETPTAANNIRTYTSKAFSLSGDNQHDIIITKQDGNYGTKTFSTYISAKFFTIDITADGKGIGLLTSAPDKGIALGDYVTTDLTLYKSSGNSPSLIFQRGTLTDSSNDWRIYDKGGWLYFGQRGSSSTEWPTNQEWYINTSGLFSGTINWSNVNNKPDYITAQGTVTESTNGSGLWRYRKWNSSFQEVWYHGSVDFSGINSKSANGWYRRTKDFAIPYDSMTNITAFDDNAVPVVTGAYSGTLLSTGGFKSSGTIVELQEISGATITASTVTGWNIYIAGMPR